MTSDPYAGGDHDPLPELAKQLTALTGRSHVTEAWQALEPLGGVCGAALTWPRRLRPSPSSLRWLSSRQLFPRPVSKGNARQAAAQVMRAQIWLETQNLHFLAQHLAPFLEQAPAELARVSPSAVPWALAAYDALRPGRHTLQLPLTELRQPGDCLALHLCLERLVTSQSSHVHAPLMAGTENRRPGGLRFREFLTSYPAIAQNSRSSRVAVRLAQLIEHSPLTQWVYGDLVATEDRPASADILNHLLPKVAGHPAWYAAWISKLAATLVAVLLSPPPGWEALCMAEQRFRDAQVAAGKWHARLSASGRRRKRVEDFPAWRRCEQEVMRTRDLVQEQHPERIRRLAFFFRGAVADGALVQYRWLSMLLRHLSVETMERSRAKWEEIALVSTFPRISQLIGLTSPLYDTFVQHVRGGSHSTISRQDLQTLFDPAPLAADTPDLRRLAAAWTSTPLRLPVPPDMQDHLPTPATVMSQWLETLAENSSEIAATGA